MVRARSSAGEHLVDIEGVAGSIPAVPTIGSHLFQIIAVLECGVGAFGRRHFVRAAADRTVIGFGQHINLRSIP